MRSSAGRALLVNVGRSMIQLFELALGWPRSAQRRLVLRTQPPGQHNTAQGFGEKEVADARRVLAAMAEAAREKRGAVQVDGRLIDVANLRMAHNIVRMAEAIAAVGAK